MEIGEFFDQKANEIKVLTNPDMDQEELELLKEALRQYRVVGTVKEWNRLREEAKEHFPEHIISRLDASGYIYEWLEGK
jgi:hypothetical protein